MSIYLPKAIMYEWFIRGNQTGQSVVCRCKVLHFSSSPIFGCHLPCSPRTLCFPCEIGKHSQVLVICVSVALRISRWNVGRFFRPQNDCGRQILICAGVKCRNFHETSINILCQLSAGLKWKHFAIEQTRIHLVNKFSQLLLSTLHLRFSFFPFFFSHDERLLLGNNKNKSIRSIHRWRI